MKKHTLKILIAFMLILTMFLSGCGKPVDGAPADGSKEPEKEQSGTNENLETMIPNSPNSEKTDETLVVAVAAEPVIIAPLLSDAGALGDFAIQNALHTSLFTLNEETYAIEYGGLAKSVEEIEPGYYRISLRDDVTYNDGTKMTAHDVVYTFNKYYDAGIMFTKYLDFDKLVAEDDYTLILKYFEYMPGWQFDLTEHGIFNESIVEAAGGDEAFIHNPTVTSGKYKLVEWKTGQHVLLERNEDYWDKEYVGYYKYIKFIPIPDAASRVMSVQSGDADIGASISVAQAVALDSVPGVTGEMISIGTTYNMYFNNDEGIFTDSKVREAVMYMVDSEAVNQLINMGKGEAVQGFYSELHPYYHDYYEDGKHPYDLEKGKQLLADAGYPNGFSCKITCAIPFEPIAVILQESLRKGGIDVTLQITEPSVNILSIRAGDYDIAIATTSYVMERPDAWDLIDPAQIGTANGGPRISDPAMSEMISRAKSPDPEVSAAAWEEIIDYIFENNCLVGLCSQYESHAVKEGLTGLRPRPKQGTFFVTNIRPA